MKQELLPCPFCGGKAILNGETAKYIQCERCLASTSTSGFEEVAINAWNTRHDHTEHNLEMMQELTTEIDWEQRRYEICKSVLPAIYTELYREMKKKSPQIARDYEENIEKWSVNQAIALANKLINQLKQQSDE